MWAGGTLAWLDRDSLDPVGWAHLCPRLSPWALEVAPRWPRLPFGGTSCQAGGCCGEECGSQKDKSLCSPCCGGDARELGFGLCPRLTQPRVT